MEIDNEKYLDGEMRKLERMHQKMKETARLNASNDLEKKRKILDDPRKLLEEEPKTVKEVRVIIYEINFSSGRIYIQITFSRETTQETLVESFLSLLV